MDLSRHRLLIGLGHHEHGPNFATKSPMPIYHRVHSNNLDHAEGLGSDKTPNKLMQPNNYRIHKEILHICRGYPAFPF
jgi:hypothetical protein